MIKIERAKVSDIDDIFTIRKECWLNTYPSKKIGITQEDIKAKMESTNLKDSINRWTEGMQTEDGKTNATFVAKQNNRIVGFIGYRTIEGRRKVGVLYVQIGKHRQGIGGLLMHKALEDFGRNQDIYVEVAAHNKNAIKFYEHFGFVKTGVTFEDDFILPSSGKHMSEIEMILKANNGLS